MANNTTHIVFNYIKGLEIENAKTGRYDDKEMVKIISKALLNYANNPNFLDEPEQEITE